MKVALAQINPTVGDIAHNGGLVQEMAARAHAAGADLVVLPELALCGYPPRDLLLREGFIEACEKASRTIGVQLPTGMTVVLGLPMHTDGRPGSISNSLVAWRDGKAIARYDKRLLPTYDVFDEDRYFEPGTAPCVIEVPTRAGPVVKVGLAICEDLWRGDDAGFSSRYRDAADPVEELVRAGAGVIAVPSASPFVLAKGSKHRQIIRSHAVRHGVHVAAVNQVGGNDDLLFDGHASVVSPGGNLMAAAPGFAEHLLLCEIEPGNPQDGVRAVADQLLGSCDEELLYHALVMGIRDYCGKTGFSRATLGLSGGIDSALTAVLAAAALGPGNVLGVSMPGPYSSEHSRGDAHALADRLGMRMITMPIEGPMEGARRVLDLAFETQGLAPLGRVLPDLTEENLQSRLRGTLLMAQSNRSGAIVLTTGNKSEMAVGYATLYGDMNGGLAVLSDVTKQRVYALSRWINANHARIGFAQPPIPVSSIEKPPSAELRPDQKDQDSLPPYETLDAVIEAYIEGHQSPATIARTTGIDETLVRKLARMMDLAEYKRKQAAVGLKVTTVAFGSGRRVPIAQRYRAD
ncbi:MAG TPA: NAD+ synthase [Phycisphaerales bacterium]|nr:NAD+ synthase [Phycisphaerales bacterium]